MNFKIDENLPTEFVEILGDAGHSSDTIVHEDLGGADDAAIAAVCLKEGRILITLIVCPDFWQSERAAFWASEWNQ